MKVWLKRPFYDGLRYWDWGPYHPPHNFPDTFPWALLPPDAEVLVEGVRMSVTAAIASGAVQPGFGPGPIPVPDPPAPIPEPPAPPEPPTPGPSPRPGPPKPPSTPERVDGPPTPPGRN